MSQKDIINSVQVAEDSRNIAEASKKDSSVMLSIGVLTMTFLPATFIAVSLSHAENMNNKSHKHDQTVFAMPLFDWNANEPAAVVNPRFKYFWATAIPLTVAVLSIWTTWIVWNQRRKTGTNSRLQEIAECQVCSVGQPLRSASRLNTVKLDE